MNKQKNYWNPFFDGVKRMEDVEEPLAADDADFQKTSTMDAGKARLDVAA